MASQHDVAGTNDWVPAAELGGGVSKTITDSTDFRVEAGYRYDWDDKTIPAESGYGDWFLGLSVVSRFGAPPAPPAEPVAPPPPPPVTTAPRRTPTTTASTIATTNARPRPPVPSSVLMAARRRW